MFDFLARQTFRSRWIIIALGFAALLIGVFYGIGVTNSLKDTGTSSPSSESEREAREMGKLFPKSRSSLVIVASSPTLTVEQPKFRAEFFAALNAIRSDATHPDVTSFYSTHDSGFVSRNRHETFAIISIPGTDAQQQAAYTRIAANLPRLPDLTIDIGGQVVADMEANAEVPKDLAHAFTFSTPILLLLLVIVFRSLIAALLPFLVGAVAVLGAFSLTRIVTEFASVSIYASNIVGLLGFGLAIDYSLLFVSRFRDELASGKDVPEALACTVKTAGESIFLSGSTVALSLLGLLIFPEPFLRSMGLGGSLAVVMAMVASLTVLPAILGVIGPSVNRLTLPIPHPRSNGMPVWRAFGAFVVRHAAPILVLSLGLLLAAGIPFLHVRFADPNERNLPRSFPVRQIAETVQHDFPNNANPPIEVLINMPAPPTAPDQLAALSYFAAQIQATPGVKSVTSLVTLDKRFGPAIYAALYKKRHSHAAKAAIKHFVKGDATLLTVSYRGGSQDAVAQNIVRQIRHLQPPSGSVALVGGDTAGLVDRLTSLVVYMPIAAAAIMIATFAVLRFMLASIVIPLKAIVLNTLSLSAAFGLMTWIFQDGHLHRLLRFSPTDSLDPTLPVLIFVIAFGLATDYEVFLVSRIKEEYDRSGDNAAAIVTGVEKTGGIVTSAGLLLIVVVAGFGTSVIVSMKEMGVGLALAVAVDAAIVRTLLVPAAMELLGRYNWWLPGKEA